MFGNTPIIIGQYTPFTSVSPGPGSRVPPNLSYLYLQNLTLSILNKFQIYAWEAKGVRLISAKANKLKCHTNWLGIESTK